MNGLRRKGKSDFNAGIDASDTLQQLAEQGDQGEVTGGIRRAERGKSAVEGGTGG